MANPPSLAAGFFPPNFTGPALFEVLAEHHAMGFNQVDESDEQQPAPEVPRTIKKWTTAEDVALRKAVEQQKLGSDGKFNWNLVREQMGPRHTAEACRFHWYRSKDAEKSGAKNGNRRRDTWTSHEDEKVKSLKECGKSFKEIAQRLGGKRTAAAVAKHCSELNKSANSTSTKQSRQQVDLYEFSSDESEIEVVLPKSKKTRTTKSRGEVHVQLKHHAHVQPKDHAHVQPEERVQPKDPRQAQDKIHVQDDAQTNEYFQAWVHGKTMQTMREARLQALRIEEIRLREQLELVTGPRRQEIEEQLAMHQINYLTTLRAGDDA